MQRNEPRLSRRSLLAALPVAACGKNDPPERPPTPVVKLVNPSASASAKKIARLSAEEQTWAFPDTPIGRMSVVVLVPERLPSDRFPVLITMHGRGETLKGPERGARGWVDDYGLRRAMARLAKPPLAERDFEGFVEQSRLAAVNHALGQEPYEGLVVACPYTPDVLGREEPFTQAPLLASFLIDTLLTRIRSETPAIATPRGDGHRRRQPRRTRRHRSRSASGPKSSGPSRDSRRPSIPKTRATSSRGRNARSKKTRASGSDSSRAARTTISA